MRQNTQEVRRSRGRPQLRPDCDTCSLVIEAARQEFQLYGYAATSMGAVAQRAGVSTKTMYRLIPNKAELFHCVVSDRIGQFMLVFDAELLGCQPLAEGLEHMLRSYGELTLSADTIGIIRLVLAECHRFPELAATFHEVAIVRVGQAMAAWLSRQCERGLIQLDDAQAAAGLLRGMMTMEPQRAVMLGQRAVPDAAEIAARAKWCARLFLDGCRVAQCQA
jgi:AcrR family transcriptional regulator